MNRWLLLAVLSLPLVPARASSAGLGLRWDSCFGSGAGADIRSFACDSNTGSERLVGSFVPREDMASVAGLEIIVTFRRACSLATDSPPCPPAAVPEWWLLASPGGCREEALAAGFLADPVHAGCRRWIGGPLAGAVATYEADFPELGSARLLMAVGGLGGATGAVAGELEYFAFALAITHEQTVGPGGCTGCAEPMLVEFSALRLCAPEVPGQPDGCVVLSGGQTPTGGFALWQPPTAPVAARRATWGAVKSLFR